MQKLALALLLYLSTASICRGQTPRISEVENSFADLSNASAVYRTIQSGLFKTYQGRDSTAWLRLYLQKRSEVAAAIAKFSPGELSANGTRALSIIRKSLDSDFPEDLANSSSLQPSGHCSEAPRTDLDGAKLRDALFACFDEIGNNLQFDGKTWTRVDAMGALATLDDPQRRKSLFLAMLPLWQSINGRNEADSPYRRHIRNTAASNKPDSPIDAAAHTVGVSSQDLQTWLEQILDAWSQSTPNDPIEPWDYYYLNGKADRLLSAAIPRGKMLPITEQYYRDLGADLKKLHVLYDLDPRPGKAPLAYMDFVTYGRFAGNAWHPSVVRISASYQGGSLGSLNEFVHENGHAVHGMAIRTRPAFMEMGDSLFVEAFADVPSWNTYNPAWQTKYLGRAASETDSLRSQYSNVILDVAWSLFEARMLHHPELDPNAVWTQITSHYLHIVPHPELSWWAIRVQLVANPGYMVNYGVGAVVTADIRRHTQDSIGAFNSGNPRWYSWLSENLLGSGREFDTADLLKTFLGRPVSQDALLADIRRIAGSPQ